MTAQAPGGAADMQNPSPARDLLGEPLRLNKTPWALCVHRLTYCLAPHCGPVSLSGPVRPSEKLGSAYYPRLATFEGVGERTLNLQLQVMGFKWRTSPAGALRPPPSPGSSLGIPDAS